MYDQANWRVRNIDFTEDYIHVSTKDGLPTFIQDEIYDKDADFCYLPHKKWCGLLSTLYAKDNRKRAADKINILSRQKVLVVYFDIDAIPKVLCKNKYSTGVLPSQKQFNESNTPKHGVIQRYYMM